MTAVRILHRLAVIALSVSGWVHVCFLRNYALGGACFAAAFVLEMAGACATEEWEE